MVILDELPFRFMEREGFRKFYLRLQPRFNPPSRFIVTKDVLQIFQVEK
ncbi:hypothetical protein PanWU01x14_365320 [Parasponia andersonii]|uniref:Uncharacterized protein n=1 Tax=Parasponia andersonii TaxID=3476 RepID=A0A2P5A605_PARAD|nr:hypothetical protein PanWU01x14_365320 [Parasponia andersonii]